MRRVMGGLLKFIKSLRFKLRRQKVILINRVSAVDLARDQLYATPTTTTTTNEQNWNNKSRFSWDQIQRSTRNFSVVIGYGGFSTVYLADKIKLFKDSSTVAAAVKVQCSSERLNQAYKQELEILLHLNHPNIVKLLGHCDDREEGILIFEYVPNGNLQEKLHGSSNLISWKRRMAIAFQLAQAMEYLHNKCGLQIVHGDIKCSNILLDEDFNCKLCDFGSSKMGFSSTVLPPSPSDSPFTRRNNNRNMMLGSPGYTDPHYFRTGLASKKNDVYSFGVVVLELITGMEAFNPSSGERLTVKVGPMLRDLDDTKMVEMLDPRLLRGVDLEEVKAMAALSAMCLCDSPSFRPSASDILTTMRNKIPSLSFMFENKKTNL
ncbi:hypothetical protein RD792_005039 [Penstemon davidsonii]|uniref:Protein kinase domain-containing protein n=1 Tax=Penstemon davidsonii TaxID=160366 RepID=A0ABR0DJ50_9LAMI|nr:hypothetical protein RD792_005039 [Penstemon davidsonii]